MSWTVLVVMCSVFGVNSSLPRVFAEGPATPVQAETAARVVFEAGRSAYDRGAFGEALADFERAHALSPHPELLYNIGRAADADGQWRRAALAYEAYLVAFPASDNRDFVTARLEKMRALEQGRERESAALGGAGPTAPTIAPGPTVTERVPLAVTGMNDQQEERPLWKRTWFWSAVGIVVAAGAATAVALAVQDRDPARAPADVYVVTHEVR